MKQQKLIQKAAIAATATIATGVAPKTTDVNEGDVEKAVDLFDPNDVANWRPTHFILQPPTDNNRLSVGD